MIPLSVNQKLAVKKLERLRVGALFMDADELLRLKQVGGLAAMFQDEDYSKAWK